MVGMSTRVLALLGFASLVACSGQGQDDATFEGAVASHDAGSERAVEARQGSPRGAEGDGGKDGAEAGKLKPVEDAATLGEEEAGHKDATFDVTLDAAAQDVIPDVPPQDTGVDEPVLDAGPDVQDAAPDVQDAAPDVVDSGPVVVPYPLGCGPGERYTLVTADQYVRDNKTGLTWQRTRSSPTPWRDAMAQCQAHGERLGTVAELKGIAGAENYAACAWTSNGWGSWSSESIRAAGKPDKAWYVMSNGTAVSMLADGDSRAFMCVF